MILGNEYLTEVFMSQRGLFLLLSVPCTWGRRITGLKGVWGMVGFSTAILKNVTIIKMQ